MPPGCEAALLACDLLFPSLLMQWLCSGTAGCLLVRTQTDLLTTQTRGALFSGASPAQPSPLRPSCVCTKNQALKKNTRNYEKGAPMTPKCYKKICTNDTFSRVTPNMKNCDWTAQAAADGGSGDPENHEKKQTKRPASQHSPRTRFFEKVTKKVPQLVP